MICRLDDFTVLVEVTIKTSEYLDLARELKNLWNMMVKAMPIRVGALGTATKSLKKLEEMQISGKIKTIQTTALLIWPEYWEEFWRPEETCCHLCSSERPPLANSGMKNTQWICYGDISYHTPKMDSSNLNIFAEISSLGKDNFSFLTRHLTDCKPSMDSTSFVWLPFFC